MAEVKLPAERRTEVGKGAARRARAAGRVPGIVYGKGMEPVAVEVSRRELVTAFHSDAGMNTLLDIELEGKTTLALARELQRDPVKGTLLHVDFVKIDAKQAVEVEVPVHVIGEAPGQKEGGVLEHPLFQLHVRCLPLEVPESIEVDVSSLNIGDALRVQDITTDDKFEILNDPEAAVVAVAAPVSEEELEAMEAAASGPAMEGVEAPEGEEVPAAEAAEGEEPTEEAPADGGDGGDGGESSDPEG
jgi:large subunit ribosomal protein L25